MLPGELGRDVATRLGLGEEEVVEVAAASALYDVGKLALPSDLVNRPGALEEEDWPLVRLHTIAGEHLLSVPVDRDAAARILRGSREHFDGSGYPDHLAGEEIPLGSRIVSVCSAFDAMTTDRPHWGAVAVPEALEELRRCAGTQFDPHVVSEFCQVVAEHRAAAERTATGR